MLHCLLMISEVNEQTLSWLILYRVISSKLTISFHQFWCVNRKISAGSLLYNALVVYLNHAGHRSRVFTDDIKQQSTAVFHRCFQWNVMCIPAFQLRIVERYATLSTRIQSLGPLQCVNITTALSRDG